jgi:hypothetical protein
MIKALSRALAILLLALIVVVTALMAAAWTMLPLEHTALTLHGETFSLADLQGWSAVLFFILAVAAVVIVLVVALALVVVVLGFGALGIAVGLLVTVAALALVAAPFALVVWAAWQLVRTRPTPVVSGP